MHVCIYLHRVCVMLYSIILWECTMIGTSVNAAIVRSTRSFSLLRCTPSPTTTHLVVVVAELMQWLAADLVVPGTLHKGLQFRLKHERLD